MMMNSPLLWLRDAGDRGIQSVNFQGIGVTPWMQPTLPMLGMQNDVYHAMAAAALQEMRVVDPSKQNLSSFLQFQQTNGVPHRSAGLMQPQMLQQSQPQPTFHSNLQETQSLTPISQPILQQQLQHQNPFSNIQQQQQQQRPQQASSQQQAQCIDHQQVSSVGSVMSQLASSSQSQPPSLQTICSMQPQTFSDSTVNPAANPIVNPLQCLLGSVPPYETSPILNASRSSNLMSPTGWPPKRIAVDPVLPSVTSQCISSQVDQLGAPNMNISPNAVSLPPFPGSRVCSEDQEGSNDPQNHLLFGVNIDSSSLLMQNGMSTLKGVGSVCDSTTVPFVTSSYMSTSGNDFPLNSGMTPSVCVEESSVMQTSENLGPENPPNKTFVKVNYLCL